MYTGEKAGGLNVLLSRSLYFYIGEYSQAQLGYMCGEVDLLIEMVVMMNFTWLHL